MKKTTWQICCTLALIFICLNAHAQDPDWSRRYNIANADSAWFAATDTTADSNIIAAGTLMRNSVRKALLIKINYEGDTVWSKGAEQYI